MTAFLFDLDRTLVDCQSYTDYRAALADVEGMIGSWDDPPTPPTGWSGETRRAMGILVALSGDPRWRAVSDAIDAHEREAIPRTVAMPGVHGALRLVGKRPAAVVTLLTDATARSVLDHHGIGIEIVVGRRRHLAMKPAPDQLIEATRQLGVEPYEVVMIGDSAWDASASEAAGCRFIGVTNGKPSEFQAGVEVAATVDEAVRLVG